MGDGAAASNLGVLLFQQGDLAGAKAMCERGIELSVNILTAMAENGNVVRNENDLERRAIALAWIFHLVGYIHQLLHTAHAF